MFFGPYTRILCLLLFGLNETRPVTHKRIYNEYVYIGIYILCIGKYLLFRNKFLFLKQSSHGRFTG